MSTDIIKKKSSSVLIMDVEDLRKQGIKEVHVSKEGIRQVWDSGAFKEVGNVPFLPDRLNRHLRFKKLPGACSKCGQIIVKGGF